MINEVIIPILLLFARLITIAVIAQFILSLLISFNVVNYHNQFVAAIWQALKAILDPILQPIRRRMPDTGPIDFSPIVLLVGIQIAVYILAYIGNHYA